MDWLNLFVDLLNLKGVLITCLIFIPLEHLLAMHPLQRVFRRGWWTDVIYPFVNGWLTTLCLFLIIAGVMVVSTWLVPLPVRAAVADQPYWLQIVEIIVVADLGVYFVHRLFHSMPLTLAVSDAPSLGKSVRTVRRWRRRYAAQGVDGLLNDATRPPGASGCRRERSSR